jgi:RimJ/RimL family protein N-acetyltransferase
MLERIVGGRIVLRRPRMSDVDAISEYCKDRQISKWISTMPYPYKKKDAVSFVKDSVKKWKNKTDYIYEIEYEGKLAGTIGLHVKGDDKAELGYWIGKPHWGKGLIPEAAKLLMKEAFKRLNLNKIYARYLEGNEKSERVMQKIGMKYEAWLRYDAKKGKKYHDVTQYCILRREFKP